MESFWISFSSDLLATLIGVGFGIPFALWINRRNNSDILNRAKSENDLKLIDALVLINTNIHEDLVIIKKLISDIDDKKGLISIELNPSIWTAVKNDIISFEQDVVLKKHISNYYFKLKRLIYFKKMYEDFSFGVSAELGTGAHYRSVFRDQVLKLANEELGHATKVVEMIAASIKKIKPE